MPIWVVALALAAIAPTTVRLIADWLERRARERTQALLATTRHGSDASHARERAPSDPESVNERAASTSSSTTSRATDMR